MPVIHLKSKLFPQKSEAILTLFTLANPLCLFLKAKPYFSIFAIIFCSRRKQKHLLMMEFSSLSTLLLLSLLFFFFFFQTSYSATIFVHGDPEWKNPSVYIGDTVVFDHKNHFNLYIFRNKNAFNLCNLTEATLLSNPNSTSFTWHPSRIGFFYFTFTNGSLKTCQDSQKLAIKVSHPAPPPENAMPDLPAAPSPANDGGGEISLAPSPNGGGGGNQQSPTFPWPSRPRQVVTPESSPVTVTDKGGAMPFINSNPAVPLPTGEVDSATLRPSITSGLQQLVADNHHMALLLTGVLLLLLMDL